MSTKRPDRVIPDVSIGRVGCGFVRDTTADRIRNFRFNQLKCMFGIDGGYGHKLYDIRRAVPASPRGKLAAEISFDYYGYLRGGFPNQTLVQQLKKDLAAFFSMGPPPLRPRSQAFSGPSVGPLTRGRR